MYYPNNNNMTTLLYIVVILTTILYAMSIMNLGYYYVYYSDENITTQQTTEQPYNPIHVLTADDGNTTTTTSGTTVTSTRPYTNAERIISAIAQTQIQGKSIEESVLIIHSIVSSIYEGAGLTDQLKADMMVHLKAYVIEPTYHPVIDACIDIIHTLPNSSIAYDNLCNKLLELSMKT